MRSIEWTTAWYSLDWSGASCFACVSLLCITRAVEAWSFELFEAIYVNLSFLHPPDGCSNVTLFKTQKTQHIFDL